MLTILILSLKNGFTSELALPGYITMKMMRTKFMSTTQKLVLTFGGLRSMKKQVVMFSIIIMMRLGKILRSGIQKWA